MNKLLIAAALILSASSASAGYYERVPNSADGQHYIPSPEEQEQAYRQKVLQNQQDIIREQEYQRFRQSKCVNRALPNGQLYTYCPD